MKCLRCESVEMLVQTRGEGVDLVEVDLCPSCGGIWLDSKELDELDDNFFLDVEAIEYEKAEATEDDDALSCPRCEGRVALDKVHPAGHPDVVLDTCPSCKGFWLDKGELEKMRDVSDRMLIASLLSLDED